MTIVKTKPSEISAATKLAFQDKVIGDFFDKKSINIFNVATQVLSGKYIATDGSLNVAANYSCSDYIPVIAGHYYSISNRTIFGQSVRCMALNTGAGTPMKVISRNGLVYAPTFNLPNDGATAAALNGVIKIPSGANYLQVGLISAGSGTNNLMLEYIGAHVQSSFTPSAYQAYGAKYYRLNKEASPEAKAIKVLLFGSSHGMNTIGQFPILAYNSGVNVICANAYKGSMTLEELAGFCTSGALFIGGSYKKFENGVWSTIGVSMTILQMLQDEDWDFIALSRSAAEDETWTAEQAGFLETILAYITAKCWNSPTVVFNSGFADSYSISTREAQQATTVTITSTAQQVKTDYGVEIIPTAAALQAVRNNDTLAGLGSYADKMLSCDSQHLDQGIGLYVTGCICYNFFLKHLGKSVLTCNYLPTLEDITPFWYEVGKYTAIDEQYAKEIRKIVCKYFGTI